MSTVNNVGNTNPLQGLSAPVRKSIPADAPVQQRAVDRLDLSGVGHLFQALKTNDIRAEKVASIKAQLAAGSYEDDHKLSVATDRLLDDLQK